jgi:O-succinylbenzoate synthase
MPPIGGRPAVGRRQRRLHARGRDVFRALDDLDLLMIEQPLHHEDLVQHATLQARIRTPLCLDESIRSAADAAAAIQLGACRIVNVKQGRVGGVLEARRVHDVCAAAGVPVWCGGMLETGIGRATNLAVASMPDLGSSARMAGARTRA